MLFNIHFFLIVVLAAQEAVVQIEARCVISSLSYNRVRVACIDDGDKSLCSMMCQMNSLLTFGTCKNGKCICYGKCISNVFIEH
ncbi:hypothetical protein QL285_090411 [Trifolium repens]|nr:hypothetical protein QL285_090411 [Trifolium repens]